MAKGIRTIWIDSNTPGIIGTKVYRDGVLVGDVAAGVLVFDDPNVELGVEYEYVLQAYTSTGQSTDEVLGDNLGYYTITSEPIFTPKYFVSFSDGDDNNDGLTEGAAWKTIAKVKTMSTTFVPGDVIGFKKGDTWENERWHSNNHPSGVSGNPIIYTAYGTGALPIFNVHTDKNPTWTSIGSDKWTTPTSLAPRRVFREGREMLIAQTQALLGTDGSEYYSESTVLTLYSTDDPNGDTFQWSNFTYFVYWENTDYILWDNVDVRGGHNSSFQIRVNCNNWVIINSNVGRNASEGIVVQNSDYLTVDNCVLDANFIVNMSNIVPALSGVDARSCGDGVTFYDGVNYCEIKNNTFINWGHAGFAAQTENASNRITNNKVYGNSFTVNSDDALTDANPTGKGILYGRAIGYSGYFEDNQIYNNLCLNNSTTNQLGGSRNHFHHNIIDGIIDSPLKTSPLGIGIKLENYNVRIEDNIIENNVIMNTDNEGYLIYSINEDIVTGDVSGNIFRNNIIKNCGTLSNNVALQYHVDQAGQGIYNNLVQNNDIYSGETVNTVRNQYASSTTNVITVEAFNTAVADASNNISGDPLLLSDYKVDDASPCLNVGLCPHDDARTDYFGSTIPYTDTGVDIGIYESTVLGGTDPCGTPPTNPEILDNWNFDSPNSATDWNLETGWIGGVTGNGIATFVNPNSLGYIYQYFGGSAPGNNLEIGETYELIIDVAEAQDANTYISIGTGFPIITDSDILTVGLNTYQFVAELNSVYVRIKGGDNTTPGTNNFVFNSVSLKKV